jgi:hypothetical protein
MINALRIVVSVAAPVAASASYAQTYPSGNARASDFRRAGTFRSPPLIDLHA